MDSDIEIGYGEMTLRIREAKKADLPDVLTIEQDSFDAPWCERDFVRHCGQSSAGLLVAEFDQQVIGFLVYEQRLGKLRVLNVAVTEDYRRHGIGTHLIDELIAALCPDKPRAIVVNVRETNDAAIAFFAKLGFRSTSFLREFYDDQANAIRLEWELRGHRAIENSEARADNEK